MNEDEPVEEKEPGLVLVGFGSNKLGDMLEWIGTSKEEDLLKAFKKWPPVYRREEICDSEEIQQACDYLAFLQDAILEYELQNPPGDEENNNG
jgi:hypothetical protein